MECSPTSGVPAGIETPNDRSTVRKAMLAIPIQIKVCFFIYSNVRDDTRLVYWTLVVPKSERQIPLTLPSTPPCRHRDRNSPRQPEPDQQGISFRVKRCRLGFDQVIRQPLHFLGVTEDVRFSAATSPHSLSKSPRCAEGPKTWRRCQWRRGNEFARWMRMRAKLPGSDGVD